MVRLRQLGTFPIVKDAIIEIDRREEQKMSAVQEEHDIINNRQPKNLPPDFLQGENGIST